MEEVRARCLCDAVSGGNREGGDCSTLPEHSPLRGAALVKSAKSEWRPDSARSDCVRESYANFTPKLIQVTIRNLVSNVTIKLSLHGACWANRTPAGTKSRSVGPASEPHPESNGS